MRSEIANQLRGSWLRMNRPRISLATPFDALIQEARESFDTTEQVEQKARKSSGAESDTPKRVSHKKTAADGPDPVPYFNDGTNTSVLYSVSYM